MLLISNSQLFAQMPPNALWPYGLKAISGMPNRICDISSPAQYGANLRDSTLVEGDSIVFTFYFGDGDSAITHRIADTSEFVSISPSQNQHYYSTDGEYLLIVTSLNTNTGVLKTSVNSAYFYMGIYCGYVSGIVFNDCNLDCLINSQEDGLQNVKVVLLDTLENRIDSSYTNLAGMFNFHLVLGTIFKLKIEETDNMAFLYSCQSNGTLTDTITGNNNEATFGVIYDTFYDLRANAGGGFARPGDVVFMNLSIINTACTSIAGVYSELQINSPLLTFINAQSIPPSSSTSSSANWTGLTIPANETSNIWVKLLVDSTAQIGDTLCFTFSVGPDTNFIANNQKQICLIVQNSFDPNLKEVYPVGNGSEGYIPENTEFTYTIHFQNTGTAAAINVTIKDSIDVNLDISTFEPITSSHPYNIVILPGMLQFVYSGIHLPDSGTSLAESNGSITFKIRALPNLGEGAQINNKAYIYFDNNEPIVTNTTLNTIELITGINKVSLTNSLRVIPNPTDGLFRILSDKKIKCVNIFDISGRSVLQHINQANSYIDINIANFEAGIYFVETIDINNNALQIKLIKD